MTKKQNNHFVPRFLTKPWQAESGLLKFLDIDSGQIGEEHPDRLFAVEGIYSDKLEAFLNKKIEKIMADQIPRYLKEPSTTIGNRKVYEALVLLFYLQAIRIAHSKQPTELERITDLKASDLSAMVDHIMSTDNLVRMPLPTTQSLFFPSSGIYPFLVAGPTTFKRPEVVVGYAMSIHPRCAIARLPKKVPIEWVRPYQSTAHMMNYSAGFGPHANRVVIHPDILRHNDAGKLHAEVLNLRAMTAESLSALNLANELRLQFPWLV